jgi:hypothetical protein
MKFNVLVAILIVVGLIIGVGVGAIAFPQTITSTQTLTETRTLTEKAIEKMTETKTETFSTTLYSTRTLTVRETLTSTVTKTTTSISFSFFTITLTRRVYPSETETVLVTDSGSGNKETRPFTLNETSDLKITIKIYPTADLKYVGLHWYLYILELGRWIKEGEINEESGTIEFYAARIPAGNYYVKVISANCKWEIKVEKIA